MALEAATFLEETFNRSSISRWNEMYTYDTSNLVLDFDDGLSMEFRNLEENVMSEKEDKVINVDKMKRRRAKKSCKNKEEVENQRMTHILMERNRRKIMNEHLAVLHSLMPSGYVPRGDQASIVGGAINFIKDLEQQIHTLGAIKRMKQMQEFNSSMPIPDSVTFPQCKSVCSNNMNTTSTANATNSDAVKTLYRKRSSTANIDISMADSHVTLKILTQKLPKQLYKITARLQNLQFTVLHLTVCTTADEMALYSFSLKVEDDCQFRSVDDITIVVTHIVEEIAKEAGCN